jgi:hypothetical protein
MVTKCANPDCSTEFRYLRHGKVFMIESSGCEKRRLDYYWLCANCCQTMFVEYEPGKGAIVKDLSAKQQCSA